VALASRAVADAAAPVRVNVVTTRNANQLNPYADVVFVQALRSGQLLVACPSQYLDGIEQQYASPIPRMNCANKANLAFMAAQPSDLVRPRELGAAPGSVSGAAVIRYNTGTIKMPPPVGTSSSE
jgi:type IV pilus biogenesis protein CpaD/CtpE